MTKKKESKPVVYAAGPYFDNRKAKRMARKGLRTRREGLRDHLVRALGG